MSSFTELFNADLARYGGGCKGWTRKFHYYFRKARCCDVPVLKYYYRFVYSRICRKNHIELSRATRVGKGLYIGHPYCITVNQHAVLGDNVNIHKGATVGQQNRGEYAGVPTIGNNVYIGINAVIVGNITVGDDVMIAPGAFVNRSVPPHSIVIGNPCTVIPRENATAGYIVNTV